MNFSSHLNLCLRCNIALRNPFLQSKSMIAYIYHLDYQTGHNILYSNTMEHGIK